MILATSIDATVKEATPNTNFGAQASLWVNGGTAGNDKQAFIWFPKKAPNNAKILTAKLRIYLKGAAAGTNDLTAKRVIELWKEPKVTWNNKPATDATHSAAVSVVSGVDKQMVEFDVASIMQDVANGSPFWGFRIELAQNVDVRFRSAEDADPTLRPVLELTWSEAPDAPDQLSPDGGSVVSTGAPRLDWRFTDRVGSGNGTEQTASQVRVFTSQANADANTSPEYDSGKIANVGSEWDMANFVSTLYPGPAITLATSAAADDIIDTATPHGLSVGDRVWFSALTGGAGLSINTAYYVVATSFGASTFRVATTPGGAAINFTTDITAGTVRSPIPDGEQRWWRVMAWDGTDFASPWSEVADFKRDNMGTLSIISPGATVPETTPPFSWTLTGETQSRYRVTLFVVDAQGHYVDNLLWRVVGSGTTAVVTPPENLIKTGKTYIVRFEVWDTESRVGNEHITLESTFTYVRDGTPTDVLTLTAVPQAGSNEVVLTWTRAAQPDFFSLRVNGSEEIQRIVPIDVFVSGTTYRMSYWAAQPRQTTTYEVEAVVISTGVNRHSNANPTTTAKTDPIGIWLVDQDDGKAVQILGKDRTDFVIGEQGATFNITGSKMPVRRTDVIRGYEGSVAGAVIGAAERNDFLELKRRRSILTLIVGDLAIPIRLEEASANPTPIPGDVMYGVSFAFFQVGEPWPVA